MNTIRVAVFIDNSNVFKTIHRLRIERSQLNWPSLYDPLRLARIVAGARRLKTVYFYCVPPPEWLLAEGAQERARYVLATKYYAAIRSLPDVEVKYGYLRGRKNALIEKNVDTQLAVNMVAGAALDEFDVAILISNDGDYTSAVENTIKLGKKVEVIFFGSHLSSSLRNACNVIRRARRSWFQPLRM